MFYTTGYQPVSHDMDARLRGSHNNPRRSTRTTKLVDRMKNMEATDTDYIYRSILSPK